MLHRAVILGVFPWILVAVAAAASPGCSSQTAQNPGSVVGTGRLPPWTGQFAEMFDDRIDRTSLDSGRGSPPASDSLLRGRAQASDYVLHVRVTAFASRQAIEGPVHHLLVAPVGDPIAGPRPTESEFDLQVAQSNPFLQVMAAVGQQVVQRTFVAFLKRFAGPNGPELHWYMASESPELINAVRDARLLMEVRASNP